MAMITVTPVETVYSKSCITVSWKIANYFNHPQELNVCLQSQTFHYLDAVWFLSLNTKCKAYYESAYYIGVFVTTRRWKSPKHKVQVRFSILRPDGSTVRSATQDATFEPPVAVHGNSNLLKVSELNEKRDEIAPDGVLLVKCTMMFNVVEHVDTAVQTQTHLDKEILGRDFKKLLLSEESTDVTLKVKDREYKAHRAVLAARSRVFADMMKDDWKENSTGSLEIEGCDPTAFDLFLTYMYCGEVEDLSMDMVVSLHTLAKKYEVFALKSFCVQFITDNLSVDLYCDVLSVFAEENDEIMRKIVEFYVKNRMAVLLSLKWLEFIIENPFEANRLLIKAALINQNKQHASQ